MGKLKAVDLFCGAGGTSSGLKQACDDKGIDLDLLAINHWAVAIKTHTANHPEAKHICETLDSVDPLKAVPGGKLDLLVASPECTHHANARGGKPMSDQSRASAWHIPRWAGALMVDSILIENVKEFRTWGPLGHNGRPLESRKGELYHAFLNTLRAMGYAVEDRVLNAAHYGDATSRERLFIMCRRGRRKINWPTPTHSPHGNNTLFGATQKWRTARDIIDWDIKGESIFSRKKPLADNTLKRIAAGLKKFGGKNADPFLVMLYGTGETQPIDKPLPTVTAQGNHIALCEPFIIGAGGPTGTARPRSVNQPLKTILAENHAALIEPYVIAVNHGSETEEDHARRAYDTDKPLPSLTTKNGYALVEPFIAKYFGNGDNVVPVDRPLPTVTTKERFALVEPGKSGSIYDIRFRMLQTHELSAAMGFGSDYQFAGGKTEQTKQIGNAVCVNMAKALCAEMVS